MHWASMMDWLAPLLPVGYIGCAASPSSVTRPNDQRSSGRRTKTAPRNIVRSGRIRASRGPCQPSKYDTASSAGASSVHDSRDHSASCTAQLTASNRPPAIQ